MEQMLKVSIITVTYNSAETIADTIESVLKQSYKNIEYWIIDGMSKDNTLQIIESYKDKLKGRLHWISEKDKGIYNAMNKGIVRCTGDVVGILNSDDFFTDSMVIEKMVEAFDDDVDALYGDVHFVKANNLKKCVRYYSGKIFKPWMVKYGFIPPHPSLYIRKSVFKEYGLYVDSYNISADFEMIARLLYKYKLKAKYLHLDFVTMRTGGTSTRNWNARKLGTNEDLIACRQLGIKTNKFKIWCKFFIKTWETIFIKS
jgi:glycosyltransferase involved in cell wall biosynthesis